jgi:hypothetical protein
MKNPSKVKNLFCEVELNNFEEFTTSVVIVCTWNLGIHFSLHILYNEKGTNLDILIW